MHVEFCVQSHLVEDVLDAAKLCPRAILRPEQFDEFPYAMRHQRTSRIYEVQVYLGVRLLGRIAQVANPVSETKRCFGVHVDAFLAERHQILDFSPLLIDVISHWREKRHQVLDEMFTESVVAAEESE